MFFKRILVTGGAGFLGYHLCRRLLAEGAQVICMDDLSTGDISNASELSSESGFQFVKHDVRDPIDLEGVDCIYNLACPASPPQYQKDPVGTLKTSVFGALNVLELARKTGARALQASTSEIYGDPLVHPQPESYLGNVNTTGPRACYDEGKRCAETLFFDYRRSYGTSVRVARIFNTYGPRMKSADGRVVSNFISQALRGEDLTVYGTGQQTRSFCYVDDLVDGLIRLMTAEQDDIGPINLGNPREMSVLQLAEAVIQMTGSSSRICFLPLPKDDPQLRRPDIAQAKKLLGWEPKVSLEQGLERMIANFREHGGAHVSSDAA